MPARKSLKPRPKKHRIHAEPLLTEGEIAKLKARATADMRSIANYVAYLVVQDLQRRGGSKRAAVTGLLIQVGTIRRGSR